MNAPKQKKRRCPVMACGNLIGQYGEPGVSLSRFEPGLLICSHCGVREAFEGRLLTMKGGKWATPVQS